MQSVLRFFLRAFLLTSDLTRWLDVLSSRGLVKKVESSDAEDVKDSDIDSSALNNCLGLRANCKF